MDTPRLPAHTQSAPGGTPRRPCVRRWGRAARLLPMLALLGACASAPTGQAGEGAVAWSLAGPAPSPRSGPVVVLQSGLGDGQAPWDAVSTRVAARHPVFRYDRPGYGRNESVDTPRDPCSVATELHTLLHAARLPPPYLLVGHSLGGLYQHAFARLYPDEVAAVLLLDPTHPDHLARLEAEAPALALSLKALRLTVFGATARREFDAQAGCRERLVGPPSRPLPTRLLVSTQRAPLERGEFEALLDRLREDWLRLSGAPQVERIAGAGHYLQTERPDAVAAAIEALARAPGPDHGAD